MNSIAFTPELTDQLQDQYDEAVKDDKKQFTFEGHELLTDYAKYLLEYLNS